MWIEDTGSETANVMRLSNSSALRKKTWTKLNFLSDCAVYSAPLFPPPSQKVTHAYAERPAKRKQKKFQNVINEAVAATHGWAITLLFSQPRNDGNA